jgi:hypothetical protein
MPLSLKQFLLLVLFAGFALAALMNSERPMMLEWVKLVTFLTLLFMAYGAWANTGESRAYCAGFLLWGGFYYLTFVVIQSRRIDLGTDHMLLWIGHYLESGRVIWAVYEKIGHLVLSLLFGIVGGSVTVCFYRKRESTLIGRQNENAPRE